MINWLKLQKIKRNRSVGYQVAAKTILACFKTILQAPRLFIKELEAVFSNN